jgi:glycosyltransferase involved in cell wall biosynthesis
LRSPPPRAEATSILFFDPFPAGHRLATVLAHARRLHRRPDLRVVFALHPWVAGQARSALGARAPANAQFVDLDPQEATAPRHPLGALQGVRLAERLARRHGATELYFMELDTFLVGLAWRLLWPARLTYSGLVYRTGPAAEGPGAEGPGAPGAWKPALRAQMLRRILRSRRVGVVHTVVPEPMTDAIVAGYGPKLVRAPDGASPPERETEPQDLPQAWLARETRCLLFGSLSARKGLFQLLEALDLMDPSIVAKAGVLVCGRFEDGSREAFTAQARAQSARRPEILVETVDRFVADEELWWLLGRADLVLAPYQRHVGSSGVLRWAAAADRPVLAQDLGVVGAETRAWGLGLAVDTTDPARIAEALRRFIVGDPAARGDAVRRRAFAEAHSEEAFSNAVLGTIAAR